MIPLKLNILKKLIKILGMHNLRGCPRSGYLLNFKNMVLHWVVVLFVISRVDSLKFLSVKSLLVSWLVKCLDSKLLYDHEIWRAFRLILIHIGNVTDSSQRGDICDRFLYFQFDWLLLDQNSLFSWFLIRLYYSRFLCAK